MNALCVSSYMHPVHHHPQMLLRVLTLYNSWHSSLSSHKAWYPHWTQFFRSFQLIADKHMTMDSDSPRQQLFYLHPLSTEHSPTFSILPPCLDWIITILAMFHYHPYVGIYLITCPNSVECLLCSNNNISALDSNKSDLPGSPFSYVWVLSGRSQPILSLETEQQQTLVVYPTHLANQSICLSPPSFLLCLEYGLRGYE
jgi:hypothetical protein